MKPLFEGSTPSPIAILIIIKGVFFISKLIDLTGQNFGNLTVLHKELSQNKKTMWRCLCICGNEKVVRGDSLKSGKTVSCGKCKSNHEKNTYDLLGTYGIGYTSKGEEFYFDLEDYDKIKDYCWYFDGRYIRASVYNSLTCKQEVLYLHRLVMNVKNKDIQVDHIYHKRNDNRKSQLRLVTNAQNSQNIKPKSNNLCNGVYWHKKLHKWEAVISVKGKLVYLGLFDDFQQATDSRIEAEQKYYGEYGYKREYKLKE